MAEAIGQILVKREGGQAGRNWGYGANSQDGRNEGRNYTEQLEFDCPPRVFSRLLRGGPENGLRTEAIFWGSGGKFKFNGRRWLPCVFPQDFKPGRDEVRITAMQKGENNHAS